MVSRVRKRSRARLVALSRVLGGLMSTHQRALPPARAAAPSAAGNSSSVDDEGAATSSLASWFADPRVRSDPAAAGGVFDHYADDVRPAATDTLARATAVVEQHLDRRRKQMAAGQMSGSRDVGSELRELQVAAEALRMQLTIARVNAPGRSAAETAARGAASMIGQLDRLVAASNARDELGVPAPADRARALADARAKTPGGYCDHRDTPDETFPCQLPDDERERYRDRIREVISSAQTNWTGAAITVRITEEIKKRDPSFEQQLGQALLGALFSLLEIGAVSGAKAAVKAGAARMTTKLDVYPDIEIGPSATSIEQAQKLAGAVTKSAFKQAGPAAKRGAGMSIAQLNAKARPPVGGGTADYAKSLTDVPGTWAANFRQHLPHLLDDDLVALHNALPDESEFSVSAFEAKLRSQIARFDTQVAPISAGQRAVTVMNDRGATRTALVAPEQNYAHGRFDSNQWQGEPIRTGRWRFVQWVDDDLSAMALSKSALPRNGAPAAGVNEIRRTNDIEFWSHASLPHLWWDDEVPVEARDEVLRGVPR